MKKRLLPLIVGVSILFFSLNEKANALSVNGSTAPGEIFVAKKEFGELFPPVTIFFGSSGQPTPTTVTHALGNPVNERGFIWPKENFVVFGASTGFITTGVGTVLFSSPAPAVDVVTLYSITPAAGSLVGSVGYGFPDSSPDQAHGTYVVTISINLVQSGETVTFSLRWEVVPEFDLGVTPLSGATGDFGSISFGEGPTPQEFILSTRTNQAEPYIISASTPGITNEFGTELKGVKLFSSGISGNSLKHVEIPISVTTPLESDTEVVVYESNPEGNSDFISMGIAIEPPFGQQAGTYSGTVTVTMVTK